MKLLPITFVVFLLNLFASISYAQSSLFTLLTKEQTGVDFKNQIQENEELNVLSYEYFYNGGGVAVGDINNDGLPDIYFTANMKPDKLFLNLGNLKFKEITKESRIKGRNKWKTGVTMADVNGDGFLDIYICYSGSGDTDSRRNQLFVNNGDLTFAEKAKEFGLDVSSYSTQAAFFDYDRDGDLDMYLLNHNIKDFKDVELEYLKSTYDSLAGDKLFQNQGGVFIEVSKEAGISGNPLSFGLGVSISDVNNDHFPDIYVSNDYRENDYLYLNNGDGTFSDKIIESMRHISEFSMGNDIGDINNDGLPDIITLDMLPEDNKRQKLLQGPENYELFRSLKKNNFHQQFMRNMLQLNNGDGTFSEIGQLAGISNTDWSWSPLIADFDNDGYKDIFISNGYLRDYTNKDFLKYWGNYVVEKATKMEPTRLMDLVKSMPSTLTKNYIFKNQGDLTFSNSTDFWGLQQLVLSHGATYSDLDNDGDLDLILNNVNDNAFIYRNNSSSLQGSNYLSIKLKGDDKNPLGIGAKVYAHSGGKQQIVENYANKGFQSSTLNSVHFGLGNGTMVDSLILVWPDGSINKHYKISANQALRVEKVKEIETLHSKGSEFKYLEESTLNLMFSHQSSDINDFKRQPLMPYMYSHEGPVMAKADVNKDGLQDLFIGASKGQASALYLQKTDGIFSSINSYIFEKEKDFHASDAQFIDINGDGHLDLIVASGGYHDLQEGSDLLNDRAYINDGQGGFFKMKDFIKLPTSKSCIRGVDFDKDGDMDLFMGGRVVPGAFPLTPKSYLLMNDGKGNFTDVTDNISTELSALGMVTDAQWNDLDGNGFPDLIVVGEWMPISVFLNNGKILQNKTLDYFGTQYNGLWSSLLLEDLDDDGDIDVIAGNLGTNTQLKASDKQPIRLVYKDFDENGSIDPFMNTFIQGKEYPYITRDELLDQIYSMRRKFTSYKSFADATLTDIFTPDELKDSKVLSVTTLHTTCFINKEGRFVPKNLPVQCQFSPVHSMLFLDINGDKKKDLLLFGNSDYMRLRIGSIDANYGLMLLNNGKADFEYVPQHKSGLSIKGDVRSSILFQTKTTTKILLGINNKPIKTYSIKTSPL